MSAGFVIGGVCSAGIMGFSFRLSLVSNSFKGQVENLHRVCAVVHDVVDSDLIDENVDSDLFQNTRDGSGLIKRLNYRYYVTCSK